MKNLFNFIILVLILLVLILLGSIFFGDKNYNLRDNLKIENDLQKNVNQELIKSNEILEFEIKNAKDSNDHVENFARENLNLTYPDEEFIIFDDNDEKLDERR
tara:strand:- start:1576 stop:1884 length:309 start_codon:yes stop_codon:yes gene_type:complete